MGAKPDITLSKNDLKQIKYNNKNKIKQTSKLDSSKTVLYSSTHHFITESALIYLNDTSFSDKLSYNEINTLCKKAVYPDHTWNAKFGLFASHFYHDGMNYIEELFQKDDTHIYSRDIISRIKMSLDIFFGKWEDISDTHNAITCFIKYFSRAFEFYKNKTDQYINSLGYSLHFLQDLCAPHHAFNAPAVKTNHVQFEEWVREFINLSNTSNEFRISYNKEFVSNNFDFDINCIGLYDYLVNIHNLASSNSTEVIDYVYTPCNTPQECEWYQPAKYNILLAQKATYDVVKYFMQCKSNSLNKPIVV